MNYAIQLCFSPESLATLTDAFSAAGSSVIRKGDRPHVSLMVYEIPAPSLSVSSLGQDETLDHVNEVCALLDSLAAETLAFPVTLSAIARFPGDEHVVYLAPTVTEELLGLHRRFVQQMRGRRLLSAPVAANGYYLPGVWVPHVAVSVGNAADAERVLAGLPGFPTAFGRHHISAIEYISFPPGRLLHRAEFQA